MNEIDRIFLREGAIGFRYQSEQSQYGVECRACGILLTRVFKHLADGSVAYLERPGMFRAINGQAFCTGFITWIKLRNAIRAARTWKARAIRAEQALRALHGVGYCDTSAVSENSDRISSSC